MIAAGGATPPPPITPEFYDYLVFDGNAGITTSITLPTSCSIRVLLGKETQKKSQGVFLTINGGRIQMAYMAETTTTDRRIGVWYDSSSIVASTNLAFSTASFNFFMTPNGYGWGTTFKSYTKGSSHPTGANLTFANTTSSQRYTGKMGVFRIYDSTASGCQSDSAFDNYTPIVTLRPCLYNSVPGWWYVEGDTFFGVTDGTGSVSVTNTL